MTIDNFTPPVEAAKSGIEFAVGMRGYSPLENGHINRYDQLLKVNDVATLLAIHGNTVRNWADIGMLTAYIISPRGDRRFRLEDVHGLLIMHDGRKYDGNGELGPLIRPRVAADWLNVHTNTLLRWTDKLPELAQCCYRLADGDGGDRRYDQPKLKALIMENKCFAGKL